MASLTLSQVSKLVKSELTLIIIGLISALIFAFAIYSFSQKPKPQTQPQQASWQNIYAGTTSERELTSTLGPPNKKDTANDLQTYYYPTENEYRPNTVEIKENKVSIIKEQITPNQSINLSEFSAKYGPSENTLYGHYGTIAPGYFWSRHGLLVFAGQNEGNVLEIWYFAPTTLGNFLESNSDLETEEPERF